MGQLFYKIEKHTRHSTLEVVSTIRIVIAFAYTDTFRATHGCCAVSIVITFIHTTRITRLQE